VKLITEWLTRLLKKKSDLKDFNTRIRIDSEKMSDIEKMDKGFNGKTYTINGIEGDF
jgi:hypothetical protein